jgi:quinol-cytochrome oxidoreductase complex cytochrome b subunit/coenzyme F420-reducing hydrogenase delta subunit/Pyruvate/2-oxoacid:ferredoxin oxidoreductase delta subunit
MSNERAATAVLKPFRKVLGRLDALFDRLYSSRYNPLYQSGTIAVALFLVLLGSGLYLLLYYRIGAPYASVARLDGQVWSGRWMRSLHRFASDAMVVAVAVHALRMLLRGRSWGPRSLAWLSGLVLTAIVFVLGWTGFVMVWDAPALVLAQEGARFLDALPIFSEPVARTFLGERPMPGAFFFLNYFLHIALPLGIALVLYIHVSRVARPKLLPPKRLGWVLVALLLAMAVVWPVPLAPPADPGTMPRSVPLDWFYAFWLPITREMPVVWVWALGGVLALLAASAPLWTRPRPEARPVPSRVDLRLCVGCEQCFLDCPYEAIAMIPRRDDRAGLVAMVNPDVCVSCGICAGSCAPMGVGPPGRDGRDQLTRVRSFLAERRPGPTDVVVIACAYGAGELAGLERFHDALVYPVSCAGSLHTSVVEFMVRAGAGGVLVASCPVRDCWNREGPKWAAQRLFEGREAELQDRVDRARVRMTHAGPAERGPMAEEIAAFQAHVLGLHRAEAEDDLEATAECDVPEHPDVEARSGVLP